MTFEWWFAYLLTSTLLSLSPGSGAINTMTTSINHDIVAQRLLSPDSRPDWGYISYWWASDWVRSFRARSSLLKF